MKITTLLATAAIAVFGTMTYAGGMTEPKPRPEVETDAWTGFYSGVTGVYNFDTEDADAGVYAGYRQNFDGFVAGSELGYTFAENDDMFSVEAQAGLDFDVVLPYAFVGYVTNGDDGVAYGLGVDHRFDNNVQVGTRYTRTDLGGVEDDSVSLRVGFSF